MFALKNKITKLFSFVALLGVFVTSLVIPPAQVSAIEADWLTEFENKCKIGDITEGCDQVDACKDTHTVYDSSCGKIRHTLYPEYIGEDGELLKLPKFNATDPDKEKMQVVFQRDFPLLYRAYEGCAQEDWNVNGTDAHDCGVATQKHKEHGNLAGFSFTKP